MGVTRLALLDPDGVVLNVIDAPEGVGAEWPHDVLGLPGVWVVDDTGNAGVEGVYIPEMDLFLAPPAPEETPAP